MTLVDMLGYRWEPAEPQDKLIDVWLELGRRNPWIRVAADPPFTAKSFAECKSIEELEERFAYANWCLGQAYYLGDLCFIQQDNGGDEWLVIRGNLPFESISASRMVRTGSFRDFVARVWAATDDQLRELEY